MVMPLPLPRYTVEDLEGHPFRAGSPRLPLHRSSRDTVAEDPADRDFKRPAYVKLGVEPVWLVDMKGGTGWSGGPRPST